MLDGKRCYGSVPGIERVVESRARAERLNKGKTFVPDALLNQRGQLFGLGRIAARDKADVKRKSSSNRVKLRSQQTIRCRLRNVTVRRRWRCLAFREAVDLVIHDDYGNVNISQRGVNEMARADTEHIAIAADSHHGQVG